LQEINLAFQELLREAKGLSAFPVSPVLYQRVQPFPSPSQSFPAAAQVTPSPRAPGAFPDMTAVRGHGL
jgi:hypothetical protein